MRASLAIVLAQAVFDAGTTGGDWEWTIAETEGVTGPVASAVTKWTTPEPYTSLAVAPETTYKVTGQRLDVDGLALGPIVSVAFTTEKEPEKELIDVAGTITVEISE